MDKTEVRDEHITSSYSRIISSRLFREIEEESELNATKLAEKP